MAQFFSYPYNYTQNFSGTTKGAEAARIVSNKNFDDSVEIDQITFEFDLEDSDPGFEIDAIQVIGKNIKKVEISGRSAISLEEDFKFLVGRGGTFYTIEEGNNEYWICRLDSTGQLISRIALIDSFSSNIEGFASDGSFFYFTDNNKLYRMNPVTGKEIDIGGSLSSAGPITFHDGRLYGVTQSKIFTINPTSGITDSSNDKSFESNLAGTVKDLTSFKNKLYILHGNTITRINSIPSDSDIERENLTEIISDSDLNDSKGLTSTFKNLYINENDQVSKIVNGTVEPQNQNGKQYLFSDQLPIRPISINPTNNSRTVSFVAKSGTTTKIYQILLLKKKLELRYSSPTPGFGRPDTNEYGDVIQPSDFSQINPTEIEQGVIVHQNTQGQRIKQRAYASQPKYQVSYDLPIRTLKQMQALQKFREENLNFTFAQNIVLYPDRIYPAHFSSFDLPINYISKALSQNARYTCSFTITQN